MFMKANHSVGPIKHFHWFVGFCSLILIFGFSGCSAPSPEDIAKQADSYLVANDSAEAIRLLQDAISDSPDSQFLKAKLAEAYYRSGKYPKLYGYLESGSLDARNSARFYLLLSAVKYKDENWVSVLMHAKRGLRHSPASCHGFYFFLKRKALDAQLNLEELAEAKHTLSDIVDAWERLECEDQRELNETARDLGSAFESLSESEKKEFSNFESLSNLSEIYDINSGIVIDARAKLDRLQEIRSQFEEQVSNCIAEARSRYEYEWANACASQANEKERSIRVCFHNRLPLARINYRNNSLAEASAMDYCEALHGSIDDSERCALAQSVANRLNARRETAIRECEQILDALN